MNHTVTVAAKDKARQEIATLVARYQSLLPTSIKKYTEADTRREFIEPLFGALGWDVYSREEVAEEVRAAAGRVDYVFKLRGVSQFYLEAKALRAELTKPEYIKQAITYAYNKGITWAVLTDFEGLQLYNAQTGRLFINLSCDNYLADFDDLWLLSRQSLETNALNERAEKYGALPPRLGIEQQLYNQLRQWREQLYTQIYHYNKDLNLNYSQIDEVIQRLFNRLIFIRTCEDRRIEDKVLLGAVHEWRSSGRKGELIKILCRIFRDFDGYYDSDLFTLHLTDKVFIDSVTIESIIDGLYEIPKGIANYDFSLIDADVLGAVYEQYLGHVATVVKQRAREAQIRMDLGFPSEPTFELTAKKQRRKEHGIYYTPRFVTDYIVKQTVGCFLKERSHNEIINIKILDPACGSGSFLIRAYDELLRYHAEAKGKPVSQLDQWERLPILTGNIFGVDLDMQAIEIARLNLLLRSLARRETLPSLADNIRQGNSLISGTEDKLKGYLGNNWREKKPFNWEEQFGDIIAKGGFDVVIGNPPYVQSRNIIDDAERHYYWAKYVTDTNHSDIFSFFVQKGIGLLKSGGFLGLILPATWLRLPSFASMRRILLDSCEIKRVATFESIKVFEGSEIEPLILIAQRVFEPARDNRILCQKFLERDGIEPEAVGEIPQRLCKQAGTINLIVDTAKNEIMSKLSAMPKELLQLVRIVGGLRTGADAKYIRPKKTAYEDKPLLRGRNVYRYGYEWTGEYIWYRPDLMKSKQCAAPKEAHFFEAREKLLLRMIVGGQVIAAYDDQQFYLLQDNMLLPKEPKHSLKYVLAILNSKLVQFFLSNVVSNIAVTQSILKQLPIRRIDFDDPNEKKMHDDLVALVDKMLELNKRLTPIRDTFCNERDELLHQIEQTDKEIDNLVYDLYGLTEEERKIVEGE
ncbi:MAG: hypothetical protein D4R82_00245 [Dehalococcoidia bacterium]|nr:MAG: hypothetical protein D4R82_00245 [Dehalococcoidia bacterium]